MEVLFTINGLEYRVTSTDVPIDTSLNAYIRDVAQLRGTKSMCQEGGCGACLVTIKGIHPVTRNERTWVANSCLLPIFSCHGLDIITVEGVGNKNGYDRTQTRLVLLNGVQCGYCSPGMVMNMYSLLESKNGIVSLTDVEKSFGGNTCRCTGYRPILDAYKSLATDADSKVASLCQDIEELQICKKTGQTCSGDCKVRTKMLKEKNPLNLHFNDNRDWFKVYTANEIFNIIQPTNRPYMLVAGNTGHGIYRRDPNIQIFIDITAVQELRNYSYGEELEIGGNVTITELIEIFETAGRLTPGFAYLLDLNKHLELVANVGVRNLGTVGGNLFLKHKFNEFGSDLYLLFDTIGARVQLLEYGGTITELSLSNFLRLDMSKRLIYKVIIPQRLTSRYTFKSYKIMPRAQNAPAYVNAAFLFEFNETKTSVISAKIGFGGIGALFTRASATELYLTGKNVYSNPIFQSAVQALYQEIIPEENPAWASAEYRKKLAISLFYKFVIGTSPESIVRPQYNSGGLILERGLSSGSQSFQAKSERYPLTLAMHRVDGFVQAGGETPFSNDLPKQPRELWAAVVQARRVHANIIGFDASAALGITGVKAFFSSNDIPGTNTFTTTDFFNIDKEEIFCSGKVLYNGQPAGVILAESFQLANYAASLVNIIYDGTPTDPILPTMNDVFIANATNRIVPRDFNLYAREIGTDIRYTIEGRIEVGGQYHYYMEPQTCVAVPAEYGLNILVSSQWINICHTSIAQSLNIPECKVNVECRRAGGAFGGKLSRSAFSACVAALAAHLLNTPVRYVLTIEQNMSIMGKRNPCIADYEVAVDQNGKIQKLNHKYYQDSGINFTEASEFLISDYIPNCYDTRSWTVLANAIKTDAPSNVFARAPGTSEGIAMIENVMEHIAHVTGQDPINVRLQNIPEGNIIKTKFPEFLQSCDYYARKERVESINATNRWIKRGISIVPMQYPQNFFGHFSALVSIHHVDGTVSISHGAIEMGQGISTKVSQVAAYLLGIPVQWISIKPTQSLISPNCTGSQANISTDSVCIAVQRACEILIQRIRPVREERPNATWKEITWECNDRHINLTAHSLSSPSEIIDYNVYGFTCAEVEVDILTGKYIFRRVDILEDVGESISPLMDVGQVEGGFVMGSGYWLTEKLKYDRDGALVTNRSWNYWVPGPLDIPEDFRIAFFKDSSNTNYAFRSKVAGEPPVCMAIVVAFAIRHALFSARKDAGLTDVWFDTKGPYTVEDIFLNALNDINTFVL